MLAEAFQEEFISFYLSEKSEPEVPHKLDLLGLYGRFIDRIYDGYFIGKLPTPAGNVAAEEVRKSHIKITKLEHQLLALQALFTEDQLKGLHINYKSAFSDEELARIGIVQRNLDGKPQFIHRTFAEYYVAGFLMKQLTETTKQHIQVQELLLNIVLLQTDCHVIRAFLDGLLEKSKPSKEALKEYGEKLDEQWNGRELLGRQGGLIQTALHQAVTEDNTHIIGFLLDSLKSGEHSNVLSNMLLATDNRGRTAWHMAAKNGNARALKKIWECVDEVTPTVKCSLPLLKDTSDETASHLATKTDNTNTRERPWNSAKEEQICAEQLKKQMLLAQDSGGKTAWHLAEENCNEEVLEKIWGWAKEVLVNPNDLKEKLLLVQSRDGETAWHLAAEKCSAEILGKLWAWAKEAQQTPNELSELLLAKDEFGNTAWHAAVERGNLEMLAALWSWAKEAKLKPNQLYKLLLAKDKYGNTAWHAAVRTGNLEMIESLWSCAKEAQLKPNE
jgi:ankyrin repeat protein